MDYIIYSKQAFFQKNATALAKRKAQVLKDKPMLFASMLEKHPKQLWLHVNESTDETHLLCKELLALSPSLCIAVFRNNPDVLEGISLLKMGIKGYAHALANPHILMQIYQTLSQGSVWVYPELMQFMIASMHTTLETSNDTLAPLSPKEREVAFLVSEGHSNAKIAAILKIAEITVKKHIGTLFKKLGVKDRMALALKVEQHT